ncbi:MAG: acyltransferase family protein [Reyranellaceae bacterium]
MTATPRAATHLPALDGLRALAALWVVAFHAMHFTGAPTPIVRHGYLGVDLFFILSGFVLAHGYSEIFARDGLAFYSRYLVRRVARLWPVWLVVMTMFAIKPEIAHSLGLRGSGVRMAEEPGTWALYLLLMQSWGFTDPERINPPGWSLSYEWAASLVLPLALMALVRLRSPLACLALAALCLAAHALYTHAYALPTVNTGGAHGGARIATGVLVGILLWRAWHHRRDDGAFDGMIAGACALLGVGAMLLFLPALALDHVMVVLFVGLIGAVAGGRGWLASVLQARPLRILGEASYALYVVHWLVFEILGWIFGRLGGSIGSPLSWVFFGVMPVLSVVAALALHAVVERPSRRALRRLAEGAPAR